jgi:hypothetical protein
LINIVSYIFYCLTLKSAPPGAARPELTPEAKQRLLPFADEISGWLPKGIKARQLAYRIAPVAGVRPGQVMLFIWTMRRDLPQTLKPGYVVELLPPRKDAHGIIGTVHQDAHI